VDKKSYLLELFTKSGEAKVKVSTRVSARFSASVRATVRMRS
jgi:hypothetical protein